MVDVYIAIDGGTGDDLGQEVSDCWTELEAVAAVPVRDVVTLDMSLTNNWMYVLSIKGLRSCINVHQAVSFATHFPVRYQVHGSGWRSLTQPPTARERRGEDGNRELSSTRAHSPRIVAQERICDHGPEERT